MPKKWIIFSAIALIVIIVDIDMTAINLALSTIASDFDMSLANAQWIVSGYMAASASLMTLAGRLTDIYGSRSVIQKGTWGFLLCSLIVGLSWDQPSLIIGRILQGSCVAFTVPIAAVIVRQIFPASQVGRAVGLMVAIAGFAQASGPTFGGVIIQFANWRWIFFINIPLCLICIYIFSRLLPKPEQSAELNISFTSPLLFSIGLFGLISALNDAAAVGFDSIGFALILFCSLACLILFIIKESYSEQPLIELELFRSPSFSLINFIRFMVMFIYISILFSLGLLLQNVMRLSPLEAGLMLLSMTMVFGILSPFAGWLIDIVGYKLPTVMGLLLYTSACLILSVTANMPGYTFIIIALILFGVAIALLIPGTASGLMFTTNPKKMGAALGIFFTNGFVGGALGVATTSILLHVFSGTSQSIAIHSQFSELAKDEFLQAFRITMGIYGLLTLLTSISSLRLKSVKHD